MTITFKEFVLTFLKIRMNLKITYIFKAIRLASCSNFQVFVYKVRH